MKIDDYVTHISNWQDAPFLRTRLLDVNMRLYKSSPRYRSLVESCCEYVRWAALSKMEGYPQPFGMSGANLAIPFNIIGVVHRRGQKNAWCEILMNPDIREYLGPLTYTLSNCGSIRLPKPIRVLRYDSVRVRYYDSLGEFKERLFKREEGSYTIQHEVDHNLGILITDQGRLLSERTTVSDTSKPTNAPEQTQSQ